MASVTPQRASKPLPDPDKSHTFGILGAGQLAQMLAEAARGMGHKTKVLAADPEEPAFTTADSVVLGSAKDPERLAQVFEDTTFVAIESELIPASVVSHLKTSGLASKLRPHPDVIARFSDKLLQKKSLIDLRLPTLPWAEYPEKNCNLNTWTKHLADLFPGGYVLKWARGGYDGHGVLRVPSPLKPELDQIQDFISQGLLRGGSIYAEEWCPFVCELAVVAARSIDGTYTAYPVVVTTQEHGICSEVKGPASALGIATTALDQALTIARRVGEGFHLVGTFAVEFFLKNQGENDVAAVVNEIAPRVHNSGHYTQDAADISQFEMHWRALLGDHLGTTHTAPYFGMINILGPTGIDGPTSGPTVPAIPGVALHWYHKKHTRPRRKLGHFNIIASSLAELEERMKSVRDHVKAWEQQGRKNHD